MEIGDVVKYHFPTPLNEEKRSVLAKIDFIGTTNIVLKCADQSRLKVSFKNFNRIEHVDSLQKGNATAEFSFNS